MYLGKRGLLLVMIVLLLVGGISLFSFQNRLTGLAVFTENMDVPEETSAPEEVTPAFVPISPSVTIQTDLANTTQCGYVNNSITLTSDVTANATCFNINVSHVILNCNRFNINYSITGVPGSAINISNENNITVQNCNIYEKNATNDQKPAIRLVNVTNSSLQSNVITTLGNASYGLYVINSTLNNFYDNRIITVNESAYGIYLVNDSQNNTFTDNNISARAAFEILDETGDDYVNLFVYNNSFGEIKWMNNGSMGFLHNLTFNITNDKGVSLNFNLFIGENVIAVNTSAFSPLRMNSTANITLRKLSFNKDVTVIKRMENFTIDAAEIRAAGTNCNGTSCAILNYSNTTGDLFFNTTYFSSFTAEGNVSCGEINRNTTLQKNISVPSNEDCFTFFRNDIVLNCNRYTIDGGGGSGVGVDTSTTYNGTIKNCKITRLRIGIVFDNNGFYFFNNTITYMISSAFSTSGNPTSNTFENNNISHNFQGFGNVGSQSNFLHNKYFNNSRGYHLSCECTGNNFTSETLVSQGTAIWIDVINSVYDNTFRNSNLSENTYDLNISYENTNITFVNTSIHKNSQVVTDAFAYFKSSVIVNVTDEAHNPVESATATAINSIERQEDSQLTVAGLARLEVTESFRENNINYYITPSTIKVSKNNFTQNSTTINLVNVTQSQANLTIMAITCGSTLTTNFDFGNNYFCNESGGLLIGANDININGKGYNLSGLNAGIGINLTNRNNITLSNLRIQNFTRGVSFTQSNYSTLTNLRILNNSIGIYFENSRGNKVYDTIFDNNTNTSVYAVNDGHFNNSLINVSLYNLENITISGSASIFRRWYVDVNVTFNGNKTLSGATIYGYLNNTLTIDDSAITGSNGMARLILAELKKNISSVSFLTPHTINLSFTYLGENITNSTQLNLTQTNNTLVRLNIPLNCTTPSSDMVLTSSTTFCPGTYDANKITIQSNVVLSCSNTILVGTGNAVDLSRIGLKINGSNSTIANCRIEDNYIGVSMDSTIALTNISISNVTITKSTYGVYCRTVTKFWLKNITSSTDSLGGYDAADIDLFQCRNGSISMNTLQGKYKLMSLRESTNNTIFNNSFSTTVTTGTGIYFYFSYGEGIPTSNNTFYHNNFTAKSTRTYELYTSEGYNNHYFNTTVNGLTQGNSYSDYCDKGRDTNGDDYADASSTGAVDWPYNSSVSSKIYESGGQVVDYGPKIISCPPTTQFLGSAAAAAAAAATASAGGGSAPAAPPPAAPPPPPAPSVGSSSPAEAAQFLQVPQIVTSRISNDIIQIVVSLENTGTKTMQLFPQLLQDIDDPFFIVTRKTLGAEGSFAEKASSLAYSKASVAGRLLKAEILNPEQIILQPGEKIEKTLQIKEGLAIPRQIKIQFTTLGEAVKEQEFKVEKKAFSGTAIDLDTEQNTMDMYAIFVPEELTQKLEQAYAGGGITGAAVVQPAEQGEYLLELSLDKKETPKPKERRFPFRFLMLPSGESAFADLYGPYKLKEGQSFIFAQQFKYDPKVYTGEYEIKTKIYRDNNVLVENEFPVMLGAELPPEQQVPLVLPQPVEEALSLLKRSYQILGLWIVPAVLIFLGILVGGFVFIRRH